MRHYSFITHNHIGDNVICTGAVRNVVAAYPDIRFVRPTVHRDIYANNPDFTDPDCIHGSFPTLARITYGPVVDEQRAANGNLVEGFTKSLCAIMGIPMVPISTKIPIIMLTDEEKEISRQWSDFVLLNANCQTCSISKGYPHWQDVVDILVRDGYQIAQIGGREGRDLTLDLHGVTDMRGRSTLRDLCVMAHGCRGVVSPPSAITNIAAAFGKPQVSINASREPDGLTDYPNILHVSHKCACGWGEDSGCITLRINSGSRACLNSVSSRGRNWCICQWEIPPEVVADAVKQAIPEV